MRDVWHNRFMSLAQEVATWSKDYKKVGAIIVDRDTNKVLSLGFNGMPHFYNDRYLTSLTSEEKAVMITHAEKNALEMLSEEHYNRNLIMYITKPPCIHCSKLIVYSKANITSVYYCPNSNPIFDKRYKVEESLSFLQSNGIIHVAYNISPVDKYELQITLVQYLTHIGWEDSEIAGFIYYCSSLLLELDTYHKYDTSFQDSLYVILGDYGVDNIYQFCKETLSSRPTEFIDWIEDKVNKNKEMN